MSDLGEEDELVVASKTWNRVIDTVSKCGYREGAEDGSLSTFQDSFDVGYEEAFKTAFILGKYKGLATILPKGVQILPNIELILNSMTNGACCLCTLGQENLNDTIYLTEELEEVTDKQRQHSKEIIDTLHEYFQPLLKEYGIDITQQSV